jgi:hypothetical protein
MLWTLRYRDRIMKNVSIEVDPPTLEEATRVGQDYVSMVLANPNIVFVSVEPACVWSSADMDARIAKEAQARIRRDTDLAKQRTTAPRGRSPEPELEDDDDMAGPGGTTAGAATDDEDDAPQGRAQAQAPRQRASTAAPGPKAPAPPRPRQTPATPVSRDKRRKEPPPTRTAPTRTAAEVDRGHHADPGQNEPTLGVEDPRAHARNLVTNATRAGRVGQ